MMKIVLVADVSDAIKRFAKLATTERLSFANMYLSEHKGWMLATLFGVSMDAMDNLMAEVARNAAEVAIGLEGLK